MKTFLKKFSSVFVAMAMIVSFAPMSGGALLADETEETTPAATSTETEAPKEKDHHEKKKQKETEKPVTETTKEAETKPSETKKETEAATAETTKETTAETTKETEATTAETTKETEATTAETTKETEETTAETTKETEATTAETTKETEETTAETTKETEESAAETTKETEESAPETAAETEPESSVPSETETPSETEVPEETEPSESAEEKLPEAPVTQDGKKEGIGTLNAKIVNGILSWDAYPNADWYDIEINGVWADYDSDEDGRSYNINQEIDYLLTKAEFEKTGKYEIHLYAYAEDFDSELIAEWKYVYNYNSPADYPTLNKINVSIKNGVMSWGAIRNTVDYCVIINGYRFNKDSSDRTFYLNEQIDWMIKAAYFGNLGSYRIRVVAYNANGNPIAEKAWDYVYNSTATPWGNRKINNISVKNGIMTWDPADDAETYWIEVEGTEESFNCDENYVDLNDFLTDLVTWEDGFTPKNQYKVTVYASCWSPEGGESEVVAEGTYTYDFEQASNPLNVKGRLVKVKKKKIKKKKQVLSVNRVIAGVASGRGQMVYTKLSGPKKVLINRRTGAVTIKKKGLKKKKTYKVKVRVQAMGNYGYAPSEAKVIIFKIKVK